MRILAVTSTAQLPLLHQFLATWQDPLPLEVVVLPNTGSPDFGAAGFRRGVIEKQRIIRARLDDDEPLSVLDVDIQFFRSVVPLLEEHLRGYDILFQREHLSAGLNSGIVVIQPSDQTRALYDQLLAADLSSYLAPEQDWFNARTTWNVRYGLLPTSFYARSHGFKLPPDIVLHHANCTIGANSIEQKLAQLALVRREYDMFHSR